MFFRALIIAFLSLMAAAAATAGEAAPAPCHGTEAAIPDAPSAMAMDQGAEHRSSAMPQQPDHDCGCDCPCASLPTTAQMAVTVLPVAMSLTGAPSDALPPALLSGRAIPPLSPPPMMLPA